MKHLLNDPMLKERRRQLRRKQTEAEKIFWAHARNRQLCGMKFFRQYSVGSYILDIYCPARKLSVELDGGHHNQPEEIEYDAARTEFLNAHGIEVLRFWNHDVLLDIHSVLASVAEKLTA